MPGNVASSSAWSRILAESLRAPDEPLPLPVTPGPETSPAQACSAAIRALLDLIAPDPAPPWLAPHQVLAYDRLLAVLRRHGGGVLADAVGLGKSFVALAVARTINAPVVIVVPAVLVPQWSALLERLHVAARLVTHESLGAARHRRPRHPRPTRPGLVIVDEAHRFRNPGTRRYQALARWTIATPLLLVTATPVCNRLADLLHLLRLFLADDALVAFGVPSLARAARDPAPIPGVEAAIARFVVARSRRRVQAGSPGLRFPTRLPGRALRVGPAEPGPLLELGEAIRRLRLPPPAAALFRLTLLRRLASSVPALRETLRRYEAFRTVALDAAAGNRRLGRNEFHRLFPMPESADLQLVLLPLLLDAAADTDHDAQDLQPLRALLRSSRAGVDPKAEALARLLRMAPQKTIVFADGAATVRHLLRRLAGEQRTGAVAGTAAWLGRDRAGRREVLAAFAPAALGVAPARPASRVDVLLATDLVGEGLNLQDATRVIHYDLPWSPARLAQRVGRVDRLGSLHERVTTVAFLPPEPLATAIALEQRLANKVSAQLRAGSAQVETIRGRPDVNAPLDWCDRLHHLVRKLGGDPVAKACAMVSASVGADVVILRLGEWVEGFVITDGRAAADPERVAWLLEQAALATPLPLDRVAVARALRRVAPLVRDRLAAIAAARWRGADRDRAGRRLVPLVLAAARRAARNGQVERVARYDALVGRLVAGLTAGEALLLDDLLARRDTIGVQDLLAWLDRLPPRSMPAAPTVELVAAILLRNEADPGPGTAVSA